jgi:hypothetical protein
VDPLWDRKGYGTNLDRACHSTAKVYTCIRAISSLLLQRAMNLPAFQYGIGEKENVLHHISEEGDDDASL